MPELPEVETVRRGLEGFILNAKITKIEIRCKKSFIGEPACGRVRDLRRFGKALVIDLDNGYSMMIHLRMTGQLIWRGDRQNFAGGHPSESFVSELPNKQTRVILEFDKGTLYFNDQRKFGFIKVIETAKVEEDDFIKKLAEEPWQMTGAELHKILQRRRQSAVKSVILDQTVISGLGNIYADEALYAAKIHPERKAGSLSLTETEELLKCAREVMEKSLEAGGSTLQNYVKADGSQGNYLDLFAKVYHRDGRPCDRCGTEIAKIKVGGRGTHFCPKCQKLKNTPVKPVENSVKNSKKEPK